jgi:hypothetical protein
VLRQLLKPANDHTSVDQDSISASIAGGDAPPSRPVSRSGSRVLNQEQVERRQRNSVYLQQHGNTFLGYKWLLQSLSREPVNNSGGKSGGIQMRVADVLLFTNGEPHEWIFTNKNGAYENHTYIHTYHSDTVYFFRETSLHACT